ncbi:hypothetical protein M1555_01550 [Patescibacteria group bacterium]|nr:hypothetical protein [Patescibacteria group bacterium]
MKYLLLFLFLSAISVYYGKSKVEATGACYAQYHKSADRNSFYAKARGWTDEQICEADLYTIDDLDHCLAPLTPGSRIDALTAPFLLDITAFLEEGAPPVPELKAGHNGRCRNFPDLTY